MLRIEARGRRRLPDFQPFVFSQNSSREPKSNAQSNPPALEKSGEGMHGPVVVASAPTRRMEERTTLPSSEPAHHTKGSGRVWRLIGKRCGDQDQNRRAPKTAGLPSPDLSSPDERQRAGEMT